jgi:hypothetical protein
MLEDGEKSGKYERRRERHARRRLCECQATLRDLRVPLFALRLEIRARPGSPASAILDIPVSWITGEDLCPHRSGGFAYSREI